jgi:hypothetical protein
LTKPFGLGRTALAVATTSNVSSILIAGASVAAASAFESPIGAKIERNGDADASGPPLTAS